MMSNYLPNNKTALNFIILVVFCLFGFSNCYAQRPDNSKLEKLPFSLIKGMENTPVIFNDKPYLVDNRRGGAYDTSAATSWLFVRDLITGQETEPFGETFSFVNAFVNGPELNVFATELTDDDWTHDIHRFTTTDLKTWNQQLVIQRKEGEHLFNCSVCKDPQGYLMAYESNVVDAEENIQRWNFRFTRSKDLANWKDVEGLKFGDKAEKSFCACPCIRYCEPYYYVIYGAERNSGIGRHYQYALPSTLYVSLLARSKDLITWELSPTKYPILDPIKGEGINNTDVDLFEYEGKTFLFYATGDQSTWGGIRVATFDGPMKKMFESYFPEYAPIIIFDTSQRKYIYPTKEKSQ
jgi:hypothetical protein